MLTIEAGHTVKIKNSTVFYPVPVTIHVKGILDMNNSGLWLPTGSKIIVEEGGKIEVTSILKSLEWIKIGPLLDNDIIAQWQSFLNPKAVTDGWQLDSDDLHPIILPLTWGEVTSSYNLENDKFIVDWTIYSEVNNDFFTIETSEDLEIWSEGSHVESFGDSKVTTSYHTDFTHPTHQEVIYLRIKQTDKDGQFDYSMISAIQTHLEASIPKVAYYIDLNGEKTDRIENVPNGIYIVVYEDGTREKIHKQ